MSYNPLWPVNIAIRKWLEGVWNPSIKLVNPNEKITLWSGKIVDTNNNLINTSSFGILGAVLNFSLCKKVELVVSRTDQPMAFFVKFYGGKIIDTHIVSGAPTVINLPLIDNLEIVIKRIVKAYEFTTNPLDDTTELHASIRKVMV